MKCKNPKIKDTTSLIDELDKSLEQQLHLTFSKDVKPWIGQYAGFGLTSVRGHLWQPPRPQVGGTVEARDQKAADVFLVKLQKGISTCRETSSSK